MAEPDLDPEFPLREFTGLDLDVCEPGKCRARMAVTDALLNPNGVVHGGALFTMVDTAMGGATMSTLDAGQLCASVEIQLRFLEPVASGTLEAEVVVLRRGRRIVHLEGRVATGDKTVATATGTFAIFGSAESDAG